MDKYPIIVLYAVLNTQTVYPVAFANNVKVDNGNMCLKFIQIR